MRAVILAGGLGTRLSEETDRTPKPMVEIGGKPILWHIMKIYDSHNVTDFIICLGYKGHVIKEYFSNYFLHNCDVTIDLKSNSMDFHRNAVEDWRVTLVDTGVDTMTAGRLRRVAPFLADEPFYLTYGDGVTDLEIPATAEFHRAHGKMATVTSVSPPGRFGTLDIEGTRVRAFDEKQAGDGNSINGGFFVFDPSIIDHIDGDDSVLERDVLPPLAEAGELMAYRHAGFWQAMDTLRERRLLEGLWAGGAAPWKLWS